MKDSVFIRPRIPALFTAEQLPCTPTLQLHLQSGADSCAFFVGDSLMLSACNGWFTLDLRRYRPYDLTFYSTRPDHCDDTSSVLIDVQTGPVLLLPNAFTPNNDGINDLWPGPLDIPDLDYQVQVFDRWGELLWGTKDTEEKWSGDDLPMGVYVYVVHMRDPCNPMDAVDKYGTVTLFR